MKYLAILPLLFLPSCLSDRPVPPEAIPPGFVDPTPQDAPDEGDLAIWYAKKSGESAGAAVPGPVGWTITEISAAAAAIAAAAWGTKKGYDKIKNTSKGSSEEVETP